LVLRFYIALLANPNSTPTRRMRSLRCARTASGHACVYRELHPCWLCDRIA